MTRKHVVLLDDSGYGLCRHLDGTPFLDPARHEVTLVAAAEPAAGSAPVDRVIVVDALNWPEARRIRPILVDGPAVDHVAATADQLQLPAARLRTELGVAGYAAEHMVLFRNRTLMKQHFAAAGIRTPAHAGTGRPQERAALLERYGAVELRPLDVADPAPSFEFTDLRALERHVRGHEGVERRYRLEEHIKGTIFCVDSVVRNGRPEAALAFRRLGPSDAAPGAEADGGGRCVQLGPGGLRAILLEFNRRVLRAVSWYSGVSHLEVVVDRQGRPVFRELAARPSAGTEAAFRHGFGLDVRLAALAPQVGMALPQPTEPAGPVRRLTGWTVVALPSTSAALARATAPVRDWVVDLEPFRKTSRHPADCDETSGCTVVTVHGPDEETVADRLDQVVRAFANRAPVS